MSPNATPHSSQQPKTCRRFTRIRAIRNWIGVKRNTAASRIKSNSNRITKWTQASSPGEPRCNSRRPFQCLCRSRRCRASRGMCFWTTRARSAPIWTTPQPSSHTLNTPPKYSSRISGTPTTPPWTFTTITWGFIRLTGIKWTKSPLTRSGMRPSRSCTQANASQMKNPASHPSNSERSWTPPWTTQKAFLLTRKEKWSQASLLRTFTKRTPCERLMAPERCLSKPRTPSHCRWEKRTSTTPKL